METVIQLFAALGPVVLTVMGLVVSIRPPKATGRAHWFWLVGFLLVGGLTAYSTFVELRGTDALLAKIWEKVGAEKPAPGPNKYVCTTGQQNAGKYLLLVEFGVLDRATNGQTVMAQVNANYSNVKYWFGPPLRTDFQPFQGSAGAMMNVSERKLPNALVMTMSLPSINPKSSFYMLFESSEPLQLIQRAFVEDHQITFQSDPAEFSRLLKLPYAECPRSRD